MAAREATEQFLGVAGLMLDEGACPEDVTAALVTAAVRFWVCEALSAGMTADAVMAVLEDAFRRRVWEEAMTAGPPQGGRKRPGRAALLA